MINILLILLLSFSPFALAQSEIECEGNGEIDKLLISSIELISPCSKGKDTYDLSNILSNKDAVITIEKFCEDCKAPKLSPEQKTKVADFSTENKKQFTKATLNELRKNLSNTMIDLMALRSTFNLNFKPENAAASCNINQLSNRTCKKNGKTLEEIVKASTNGEDSFQNIQRQLSYEVANTLTPPPYKGDGLLSRTTTQCMTDNELLHAKTKYLESLITPDFVEALKNSNMDFEKGKLSDSNISKSNLEILKKISEHPMVKSMLNDGKQMNAFIKSFKKDSSQENIIENLFTKTNSEVLSKDLSNRCNTTFKTLEKTLCSTEFEEGNVQFNNLDAMRMNVGSTLMEKENKEENLYTFCMGIKTKTKNPLVFSTVNASLSKDLPGNISKLDYKSVSKEHYDTVFDSPKVDVCALLDSNECDMKPIKSMNCSIASFIKAARIPDSPQSKLLASHDPNIDKILGSLIGTAPSVDDKTKIFLTEQGILPRADGTIVQAKDNDIRNPKTYSSSVRSFESGNGKSPEQIKQIQPNKAAKTNGGNEWQGSDIGEENNEDHPSNNAAPKKSKKLAKDNSEDGPEDNNNTFKENFKKRLNSLKNRTSGKNPTQETTHSPSANTGTNTAGLGGGSMIQDGAFVGETLGAPSTPEFSQTKSGYSTLDKTTAKKDSKNDALLNANRKPAEDDKVKNSTITLSKTSAGLNQIEIKVPDESILHENTQELEKKIEDYLDASAQSLQGAKTGEAFFVKLGSYEIKVAINDHGVYVAKCTKECSNLSTEYLRFLSKYFTQIKKGNLRERLKNTINKIIKKNPNDPKDKTDLE